MEPNAHKPSRRVIPAIKRARLLKKGLEAKGLSQRDLARQLQARGRQITVQAVSQWVAGGGIRDLNILLDMAEILEIPATDLEPALLRVSEPAAQEAAS